MAGFNNPGIMFAGGTLHIDERKHIAKICDGAAKAGYGRFIEPCCGAFQMSHIAAQHGFRPNRMEASDVSLFSSAIGYAINGKSLGELEIRAEGFTAEEMLVPAVVLYAQKYFCIAKQAGSEYFYNLLLDLEARREDHVQLQRDTLKNLAGRLAGINYRPLDMWVHLDEVLDDPHALIIANPPTYKAGYEKFFDTGGKMTWREPEYGIYDPKTGFHDLMERVKNAKALVICYEESEPGKTEGSPIFARYGVRTGVNTYLTTNRPDEVTLLAKGKAVSRPTEGVIEPLDRPMLPRDYVISEKSIVELMVIERGPAQYYRKLWTHGFVGSSAPINVGMFIDGMVAGVFGLDKAALTMGAFGTQTSDAIFLMYGMTVPHKTYRLTRLLTMLAQNKPFVMSVCNDIEREKVAHLKTVQMTRHAESKENRGIMKLVKRVPDPKYGYRLTYESALFDRTPESTLAEWLRREEHWQKKRKSNMS